MARFFHEWGRLLVAPLPWVGGVAPMLKFLGSASVAGILTAAAGWFGHVPGWALPLVAFVVFYLSLTAGMAWERLGPFVKVGPLELDAPRAIFFVGIKNGPIPTAQVEIKVLPVFDSQGAKLTERSWQGHWRTHPDDFDGKLSAGDVTDYGLLGVSSSREGGNPFLFIYSKESTERGHPIISRDVPLEQQGTVKLVVLVNCKTEDGKMGKTKELTFYIAPDPGSQVGYKIIAKEPPTQRTREVGAGFFLQWLIDRVCTTFERIFGGQRNPPS